MQQLTQHKLRNSQHGIDYHVNTYNSIHLSNIEKKPHRIYLPARYTTDDYDNIIEYECHDSE